MKRSIQISSRSGECGDYIQTEYVMNITIVTREQRACQGCGSKLIFVTVHNPDKIDWCLICGQQQEEVVVKELRYNKV